MITCYKQFYTKAFQCEFEKDDLCGFKQDASDDFDWTRKLKSTPSATTGPIYDHTFGRTTSYRKGRKDTNN